MFFLNRPSDEKIGSLLAACQSLSFSYAEVGATRSNPPAGWRINHMRALLGRGRPVLERAVAALFSWQLLAIDGLKVFPSTATLQPNTDVALLSRHFGIWSLDFCRVIYLLQDAPQKNGAILSSGFGYGTLPGHAVRGEEIFSMEWHTASEEVWYDIFSFSLPASPLVRFAAPFARFAQKRFARASIAKAALLAAGAPPPVNAA